MKDLLDNKKGGGGHGRIPCQHANFEVQCCERYDEIQSQTILLYMQTNKTEVPWK